MNLEQKEALEIEFWNKSKTENSEKFLQGNFLSKTYQANNLFRKIKLHRKKIGNPKAILEIGAGQGWASSFLKRFVYPKAKFTVTDISPYALASLKHWEKVYEVEIEQSIPSKSYELDFPDETFDFIFCYAAAHHFVKIEETLEGIKKILKPKGVCIFFFEPTCSRLFYPLHMRYVNSQNPGTPEDILIPKEIKKMTESIGLNYSNLYDHNFRFHRSIPLGIYFKTLTLLPFLQRWLPSSSDLVFTKIVGNE